MTTLDVDLLHPSAETECKTNKKKLLVPNPRSEFVSLRCPDCLDLTTGFSHSNTTIICTQCSRPLAYPSGGRIRLTEGVQARLRINA
jgi:small subunit ribosomal protein S27e